ncbi:MAG: imidazole glycerol phosphate synthase subunit HisF [Candidatus Magasanikbacteria bacterium]|nr:imidazole glycerol phosphate synthase subunit HisF [Candidatus Magasanikbacteria bacterium]
MLKKRLIPVLFLKNGLIVRSEGFVDFREFGNPINQLERLTDWNSDELIYVDITREGSHDLKRDDHKIKRESDVIAILRTIAEKSFMPLTFGGRINGLAQVDEYIANGADKVIINSGAYKDPRLISAVADKYGSQCIVVGIDILEEGGLHSMYIDNGRTLVHGNPIEYAKKVESLGAGEIFLNSIDRDGTARGYDIHYINEVSAALSIPVIACGGAGSFDDFVEVMSRTSASAVAAGNIFNFTENAYIRAKKKLKEHALPVR